MRVLLISHTCQSLTEGQPRARELAKFDDIELCVLVPQRFNHFGVWREAEAPQDAEYSYLSRRALWPWLEPAQNYLHWYPSLPGVLREFQPDVIDVWEETWSLCSAHAIWLRNRICPDAKIVVETEQNLLKYLPPPFELLRSYILKNADFCIGRSEEAVGVLRSKGYGGPAISIPNAVDAELFHSMERAGCRQQLHLPDGVFIAGYVGRLVEEKGVRDLLEALALCPENIHLLFAGSGPEESKLRDFSRTQNLEQRVHFLGARPLQELPSVMNALDVLVLPSRTTASWKEQFGRVLIEAHACAVPVIGSDSGAIPSVVGNGGLIVPEQNPAALVEALRDLSTQPARARELGAIGRRQVEEKYTWTRVAEEFRNVYRRVLAD